MGDLSTTLFGYQAYSPTRQAGWGLNRGQCHWTPCHLQIKIAKNGRDFRFLALAPCRSQSEGHWTFVPGIGSVAPTGLPGLIYRRNPVAGDSALEIFSGSNAQYGRVGVAMLLK